MKSAIALMLSALIVTALPAAASDDEPDHKKKCSADAATCIRDMVAGLENRGWIGIEWEKIDGKPKISHVVQDSPAAAADVRVGDVVLRFNGLPTDADDEAVWAEMKRALVPGKVITLSVDRQGEQIDIPVKLVPVPEPIIAQWIGQHMLQYHAAPPEGSDERSP